MALVGVRLTDQLGWGAKWKVAEVLLPITAFPRIVHLACRRGC